jgi:hypothetical protein
MTEFAFPPDFKGLEITEAEHVELLKRSGPTTGSVLTTFGSKCVLLPEQSNVWAFAALREIRAT